MCLMLTEDATSQIAMKDIIVYKHIKESYNDDNCYGYVTSYQDTPIKIGETYNSDLRLVEKSDDTDRYVFDYRRIEDGLHSFIDVEHAKLMSIHWGEQLVECKIPKGSIYWEGAFNTPVHVDAPCYASDTLTYIKLLS